MCQSYDETKEGIDGYESFLRSYQNSEETLAKTKKFTIITQKYKCVKIYNYFDYGVKYYQNVQIVNS